MRLLGFIVLLGGMAGACGCGREGISFATACLFDRQGRAVGEAAFVQKDGEIGVQISIRGWRLPPGVHGVHLQEALSCRPPSLESAGGHFNPYGKKHGLQNPHGPHAGDLPNLTVSEAGTVDTTVWASLVTLGRGKNSLLRSALEPGGTSLVIDAGADDERSDPEGVSGASIAGGIIRKFDGRPLKGHRR